MRMWRVWYVAVDDSDILGIAGEPRLDAGADLDEETEAGSRIPVEVVVHHAVVEENGVVRFFCEVEQHVVILVLRFQVIRCHVSLVHGGLKIARLGVSRIAHRYRMKTTRNNEPIRFDVM